MTFLPIHLAILSNYITTYGAMLRHLPEPGKMLRSASILAVCRLLPSGREVGEEGGHQAASALAANTPTAIVFCALLCFLSKM